jgi:hypothetical protein
MNALNDKDIEFIYNDIKARGIRESVLLNEIVDHLCCCIEAEFIHGTSFKQAYNQLIGSLEEEALYQLQQQTLLATNLKFQEMKKTMFSLGTLSVLLLTAGTFLKMAHMPFASISLVLGGIIVVLGFLPLFFYTVYMEQGEKKNLGLSIVGYITISFLISGVLFRAMHWPGTDKILLIGQILLVVIFLPLYLVNTFKKAKETKTNFVYVILIMGIAIGSIFMSLTVSISKEKIDRYNSIYQDAIKTSDYFSLTNDSLLLNLTKNDSDLATVSNIKKISNFSQELDKQINYLTTEMIETASGKYSTPLNFDSKDNKWVCNRVMQRDGNIDKLRIQLKNYRDYLLSLAISENQRKIIEVQFNYNIYFENYFMEGNKTSLIEAVAMLTELQKNIKLAEYTILTALN